MFLHYVGLDRLIDVIVRVYSVRGTRQTCRCDSMCVQCKRD